MILAFYFFAAILILLSFKSFRGGVEYLRFFKNDLAKPRSAFAPFVSVIAPCRGLDAGLQQNLRSLVEQDYPDYEVVFVVDDTGDDAVPVISGVLDRGDAENLVSAKLVIAPEADGCSQKVENLREAVLHVDERSEVYVFADSDARPSAGWLRHMVAPLEDESIGAATGYRWFISGAPTFGSEMRSVWNASIASALGPNTRSNFCWGGSMAIRRGLFERIDMREKWRGTLSDDFAVTRALKDLSLPIVFVPSALTASVENCSLSEMLEFTTRQMKITRVNAPALWLMSFFGSGLFSSVLMAAFLIVILSPQNDLAVFAAIATIVLVAGFSVGKAWLRLKAVKLALPQYERELARQVWTQNTLWLIAPAIFLYNSIAASISRRVTWRGTTYELKSPTETVIIAD